MLASVIYNCLKAPKSKALDIDDFIIKFLPRGTAKVKKQSQAVIKQNLLHWAAIHKAKAKASKQKGSKASPRKR